MGNPSQFEYLMQQVANGSEDAVWQLVETYTPFVLRSIRASLANKLRRRLDSQDIAQVLWASLLLGHMDFLSIKSPEGLIDLLSRIAKNKVIDQVRRNTAQKCSVDREIPPQEIAAKLPGGMERTYATDPTPSKLVSVREQWDQVVSTASERDRRILHLRMERRSFEEIGRAVQVSPMTARRAMERLIEEMSQ
jgi:RNA polymerase sigma factor (sigma-70 family)